MKTSVNNNQNIESKNDASQVINYNFEIVRDFDGSYYANISDADGDQFRGLPEYVTYKELKKVVKEAIGVKLPALRSLTFKKSGRKQYATIYGLEGVRVKQPALVFHLQDKVILGADMLGESRHYAVGCIVTGYKWDVATGQFLYILQGEDITPGRRHLLNLMADDLIKMFHEDGDEDTDTAPVIEAEDITDTEDDEDPTLTEAEKRDTLARLWDAAWREAQDDPEGTRVIVETNEQDPTAPANEFGRYYMIDGSLTESGIDHAGQWIVCRVDTVTSPYEVRRPNWACMNGYADDYTQLMCCCENPNNVARWVRLMIDAGRVTDIYADSY